MCINNKIKNNISKIYYTIKNDDFLKFMIDNNFNQNIIYFQDQYFDLNKGKLGKNDIWIKFRRYIKTKKQSNYFSIKKIDTLCTYSNKNKIKYEEEIINEDKTDIVFLNEDSSILFNFLKQNNINDDYYFDNMEPYIDIFVERQIFKSDKYDGLIIHYDTYKFRSLNIKDNYHSSLNFIFNDNHNTVFNKLVNQYLQYNNIKFDEYFYNTRKAIIEYIFRSNNKLKQLIIIKNPYLEKLESYKIEKYCRNIDKKTISKPPLTEDEINELINGIPI
jgi:hypothetical protein